MNIKMFCCIDDNIYNLNNGIDALLDLLQIRIDAYYALLSCSCLLELVTIC